MRAQWANRKRRGWESLVRKRRGGGKHGEGVRLRGLRTERGGDRKEEREPLLWNIMIKASEYAHHYSVLSSRKGVGAFPPFFLSPLCAFSVVGCHCFRNPEITSSLMCHNRQWLAELLKAGGGFWRRALHQRCGPGTWCLLDPWELSGKQWRFLSRHPQEDSNVTIKWIKNMFFNPQNNRHSSWQTFSNGNFKSLIPRSNWKMCLP